MSAEGTWNTIVDTPMGKQQAKLVLTQTGDGWEGNSVAQQTGEDISLNDIVVNGNDVSWQQTVTKPMKLNVKCNVTIDGDKFTGKAKAGMFPAMTMTGERAS